MTASLSLIANSHTLRCDAKQAEKRFIWMEKFFSSVKHFNLGDLLPYPLVKGVQPKYIESLEPEGIPVINTISIQRLRLNTVLCRYITNEDYESIDNERKPRKKDVLLTMDGGTSIGKPVVFNLEGDFAIDSHIAILRPRDLDPEYLVYLLASPLGQLQFQRAESGASGQTAVTEEDIRRFRFPILDQKDIKAIIKKVSQGLVSLEKSMRELQEKEMKIWEEFNDFLLLSK